MGRNHHWTRGNKSEAFEDDGFPLGLSSRHKNKTKGIWGRLLFTVERAPWIDTHPSVLTNTYKIHMHIRLP